MANTDQFAGFFRTRFADLVNSEYRNGWPNRSARLREGTTTVTCLNSSSVFTAIEQHFTTLTAEPHQPLAITVDHDPEPRELSVTEARDITCDRTVPLGRRDQIWRELIHRARRTPNPWGLAAVWMMLPGLKSATRRISRTTRLDIADLRSAAITGFLEALAAIDPDGENLGSALYWSAYQAARTACRPHPRITIDPTDEIDRIAARITDTPAPVQRGLVETARTDHPSRSRLEAERLGSLAHRMGVADRLHEHSHCRRHTAHTDHRTPMRGRRIVLRACSAPVRKVAKVPARPIVHDPKS